jgi:peptidoglycan hydrolase-like protein with peptidoglycan-binding domain
VNQWFQSTRGIVIVVLAIATCVLLLAVEPDDSFPKGATLSAGGGSVTVTTIGPGPSSTTTTTTVARPTLQEGSPDTANITTLQTRLNQLGFNVGAPDGVFGPGTKAQVIAFQNKKAITPADGTVNAATWAALLATQ